MHEPSHSGMKDDEMSVGDEMEVSEAQLPSDHTCSPVHDDDYQPSKRSYTSKDSHDRTEQCSDDEIDSISLSSTYQCCDDSERMRVFKIYPSFVHCLKGFGWEENKQCRFFCMHHLLIPVSVNIGLCPWQANSWVDAIASKRPDVLTVSVLLRRPRWRWERFSAPCLWATGWRVR